MNIEDDFMWVAGNAFSEMRLMVEGAITLFEDDADVLCRLAQEAQKNEAQLALNDIGTALYSDADHFWFCFDSQQLVLVIARFAAAQLNTSAQECRAAFCCPKKKPPFCCELPSHNEGARGTHVHSHLLMIT